MPFLLGLLIGPVGIYIRRNLEETEAFQALAAKAAPRVGIAALLRDHARAIAGSFLLVICTTTAYYVVLVYMPTYAKTQLGMPLADALQVQMIALAWMVVLTPASGHLSDRIGRRPVLLAAAIAYFALPYPLLVWAHEAPSFLRLLVMQLTLCSVVGVVFGPLSTALAEQFPTGVRSTGMGIAYNFAVMLFGGFAPFIITWLIRETSSPYAPAARRVCAASRPLAQSTGDTPESVVPARSGCCLYCPIAV